MHGSYLTSMSSSSLSLSPGTIAISLRSQFPSASFVDCADICVTSLQADSRRCQSGDLFVVIAGTNESAEKYIPEAIRNGAKAVLTGRPLTGLEVPQCIVSDVRKAYAILCSELADRPSRQLDAVGITGTNGKTTVSWLVRSILQSAGRKTGLSGTVEYHDGKTSRPSSLTTPDALELSELLSAMVKNRVTHAVMEVSSHALDQSRLAGTELAVGAVTNVTQDHFDYHQNLKNYAACKARIIEHLKADGTLVLNGDDPICRSMAEAVQSTQTLLTYGLKSEADLQARAVRESAAGTEFEIVFRETALPVKTTLIGQHNVSNCLAATAVCLGLGLSLAEIVAGITALENVPGRMEQVNCGQTYTVLIDYAHTDDALRHAIRSARQVCGQRLFCVFGAGGDRDSSKRSLLGVAGSEADRVIITSDNPRSEDPFQIMKAIAAGCQSQGVTPELIEDRKAAIEFALAEAGPGDLVLIAGKGHECEQILRDRKIPFRDRHVVEQYLTGQSISDSQKVSA
ncbi:UDP-N-acetylmuramoyl-L-alanyl-D-glutamate--2,6-diaminopimelate ligase MurE [Gimesia panareensis]|uniref:UDP-N-acetylmuramoyl-L-alanyl-D-glutamate--2,6-diaminopimelate ligase n=1 Tax=Gimesia panareensis TaxID=2527978 RepID=A0A517Q663_9PLAN|nr:UDP-N-acetylmuramoyl-L-alanyl-D-glutamate--2,6-diaminopimelate ligase [Gimesia panareensis]QDT27112.1 UDP-N-acetylmuramoyl-L-alanyl-D-glutamate--2,6-diaminopimelate ligase MurE [Gimesia panareensis]